MMTVRFQGIYHLKFNQTQGPGIAFKNALYEHRVLAINTVEKLAAENPETAFAHFGWAGDYIFRNDDKGDHFTQYQQALAPLRKHPGWEKVRGFDFSQYSRF